MAFENLTTEQIRSAIETQLRLQAGAPARRLAQNLNVSGVRTAGIGQVQPREEARQRASNLAAATIGLGQQDIQQRFLSEEEKARRAFEAAEAEKDRQFRLQELRESARLGADVSRTRARRALQGETIGAGLGLFGTIAKAAILKK